MKDKIITNMQSNELNSLTSSRQHLIDIFEKTADGYALCNSKGLIELWNNAMTEITGIHAKNTLGKYIWDIQFEMADKDQKSNEYYESLKTSIKSVLKSGNAPWLGKNLEREYTTPKGEKKYLVGKIFACKESDGYCLCSTSRDITEQKKSEQQLRDSEANLKSLINNRNDYIWSLDRNYNYITFNKTYADVFFNSYKQKVETGLNSLKFLSKQEKIFWQSKCEDAFIGNNVTFEDSYDLGKGMQYFQTSINPIYTDDKITGISLISIETTDIITEKIRFQAIFDNSPIPLWEEDFSEVKKILDSIKNKGIKNYRKHFDNHPEIVDQCIQSVKIINVNNQVLKLHEADTKEDLYKGLENIFTEQSKIAFKEELIAIIKGTTNFSLESKVKTLTGNEKYILLNWNVQPGYEKSFEKILLSTQDITGQKKVEIDLTKSEDKYRTLFESSATPIWLEDFSAIKIRLDSLKKKGIKNFKKYFDQHPDEVISLAGLIEVVDVNQSSVYLMDTKNKEDLTKHIPSYFTEGSIDVFRKELIALASGKIQFTDEMPILTQTGNQLHLGISLSIPKEYEQTWERIIFSFYDITERKKAEILLNESKRELSRLIENLPGTVYQCKNNKDWTMLFISEECNNLFGYTSDEITNNKKISFNRIIHPDDRKMVFDSIQEQMMKNDGNFMVEYRIITKSKEIKWIGERGSLNKNNNSLLDGFMLDITDRIESEKALKLAYEEIKDLKDRIQAENIYLRKKIEPGSLHKNFIGKSIQLETVVSKALQVANTDSTVLLRGETGTGKELLAEGIHNSSKRSNKALITINCAAIPDALLESELFGHEIGAFTDSKSKKIGMFEVANESTIFLDEIGELPLNVQAKLLRVIENREVYRIGGTKPIKIDARIIAATNQNLEKQIEKKKFRQDLYFRLNVFSIEIPPLRQRPEDIQILAEKFIKDLNEQIGKNISSISKKNLRALNKYSWPGNARELRNIIERGMITSKGDILSIEIPEINEFKETEIRLEDVERNHITKVLESVYWKVSGKNGAAEILGLHPNTLTARMKKLNIQKPL